MLIGIKGLVLRVIPKTENDRLVVLFTSERGKITVCAKGGRSVKSKLLPSIEPFAYSEFVLYEKDGYFWIRESLLIENFYAIREDIHKLALASYICDVLDLTVYENMQEPELLRLGLNSLYALTGGLRSPEKIKAVFEMRTCLLLGFAPEMEFCFKCGKKNCTALCFSLIDGAVVCGACRERALKEYYSTRQNVSEEEERRFAAQIFLISENVRLAALYILSCPAEKIYAFFLPENEWPILARLSEEHLVYRLEKKPKTLTFYNEVAVL